MITKSGGLNPVLSLCEDDDAVVRRLALLSMLAVYTGKSHKLQHIHFPTSNLGLSKLFTRNELNRNSFADNRFTLHNGRYSPFLLYSFSYRGRKEADSVEGCEKKKNV